MLFTASLHPSQTWLLRQLSFSSQRVTGKHILQDPLVTVSRQGWGTSTLKCLLSIAKAAPPAPATRGAESSYIPDPLSHPSLLLLPSPAPSPSTAATSRAAEPPFSKPRTPAAPELSPGRRRQRRFPQQREREGELRSSGKGGNSLSPPRLCSAAAPALCPVLPRPASMPALTQARLCPFPPLSRPLWDECSSSSASAPSAVPSPPDSLGCALLTVPLPSSPTSFT